MATSGSWASAGPEPAHAALTALASLADPTGRIAASSLHATQEEALSAARELLATSRRRNQLAHSTAILQELSHQLRDFALEMDRIRQRLPESWPGSPGESFSKVSQAEEQAALSLSILLDELIAAISHSEKDQASKQKGPESMSTRRILHERSPF